MELESQLTYNGCTDGFTRQSHRNGKRHKQQCRCGIYTTDLNRHPRPLAAGENRACSISSLPLKLGKLTPIFSGDRIATLVYTPLYLPAVHRIPVFVWFQIRSSDGILIINKLLCFFWVRVLKPAIRILNLNNNRFEKQKPRWMANN